MYDKKISMFQSKKFWVKSVKKSTPAFEIFFHHSFDKEKH